MFLHAVFSPNDLYGISDGVVGAGVVGAGVVTGFTAAAVGAGVVGAGVVVGAVGEENHPLE